MRNNNFAEEQSRVMITTVLNSVYIYQFELCSLVLGEVVRFDSRHEGPDTFQSGEMGVSGSPFYRQILSWFDYIITN